MIDLTPWKILDKKIYLKNLEKRLCFGNRKNRIKVRRKIKQITAELLSLQLSRE